MPSEQPTTATAVKKPDLTAPTPENIAAVLSELCVALFNAGERNNPARLRGVAMMRRIEEEGIAGE